jgi:hypothetical protein
VVELKTALATLLVFWALSMPAEAMEVGHVTLAVLSVIYFVLGPYVV